MTFDEVYAKHFSTIVKYCFHRNGGNKYLAEEATSKAFKILHQKWSTLQSHDEKYLISWLHGAANNTIKEVQREQPPFLEPLDEAWYRDLIEEQQYKNGAIDPDTENQKFLQYTEEIEKTLTPKCQKVFHNIVVDQLSYKETAQNLNSTENAVKITWGRLKKKLKACVKDLTDCK